MSASTWVMYTVLYYTCHFQNDILLPTWPEPPMRFLRASWRRSSLPALLPGCFWMGTGMKKNIQFAITSICSNIQGCNFNSQNTSGSAFGNITQALCLALKELRHECLFVYWVFELDEHLPVSNICYKYTGQAQLHRW